MAIEVRVPTLGESVTEATVGSWFKQPGEAVAVDEMLCELETDKVAIEVPSPVAGVLAEHVAAEGDTVEVNALLATINEGEGASAAAAASAPVPAAPAESGAKDVEHAPSAKKAMAEAGLSADQVSGSGRDGRIMKEDVAKVANAARPLLLRQLRVSRRLRRTDRAKSG